MIKNIFRFVVVVLVMLQFNLSATPVFGVGARGDLEVNRARLLSYLLREQLTRNHFSGKEMDDALSQAAYDLYVKQLDFQKRFLLQEDLERLGRFRSLIDDEMLRGLVELPDLAWSILEKRIHQVEKMTTDIMAQGFDFSRKEDLETDVEKIDYCRNEAELRERWRKILKFQVLNRYLDLREDKGIDTDKAPSPVPAPKSDEAELLIKAMKKVGERQEQFFSRMLQETTREHYDRYFDAITRAYDPHTDYLPPRRKEDFDISMRGSLEGIGATLREEDGYIKVVQIIPGSAAYRQGQLQAEDIILAVAQADGEPVDITDTRIRDAVSLIRGKKGTVVRLTVKKPDGTRLIIPIVRDVVQIEESFVKSTVMPGRTEKEVFGYIRIPAFYRDFEHTQNGGEGRNVTDDVQAAIAGLKKEKISGLILDLRNNGGGALTDAVSITGLFIKKGPVVQVKDSHGTMKVLRDPDPSVAYDGPVVVLVNRFSASASEILAGALQDYGRAIIIGSEHTHGKGTVQAMIDLDQSNPLANMQKYMPLGALKLTIQKFYRVSGGSTQYKGVHPDIVLPDPFGHMETGEKYLDYSLPWDTVSPVPYSPWTAGVSDRTALVDLSRKRTKANDEFKEIKKEAEEAQERREQTLQPLQIDDAWKERQAWHLEKKDEVAGLLDHGGPADGEMGEEGAWIKEIKEDPFALEGLSVLEDMLSETHESAHQTAGTP